MPQAVGGIGSYMNSYIAKLSELTLIYAVGGLYIQDTPSGRLRNLYQRLINSADKELSKFPKATDRDREQAAALIQKWGESIGWLGKEKHVCTAISFCLGVIENSEFDYSPRITETMNEIIDYFERVNKLPAPSPWSGEMAAMKWDEIVRGDGVQEDNGHCNYDCVPCNRNPKTGECWNSKFLERQKA